MSSLAFAQGFADRAIQRREEDRRAQHAELLRQRELADWKTKEAFSSTMREDVQIRQEQRAKNFADAERKRRNDVRRKSLVDSGVDPRIVDRFVELDMPDADILKHSNGYVMGEDGKTIELREDFDKKQRVKKANAYADARGWGPNSPARNAILGEAMEKENFLSSFLGNFKVYDKGERVEPVSLEAAGIKAAASGTDPRLTSGFSRDIATAVDESVFDKLYNLTNKKIRWAIERDPVTNQPIRRIDASESPEAQAWLAKVSQIATDIHMDGMAKGRHIHPREAARLAVEQVGQFTTATPNPKKPTGKKAETTSVTPSPKDTANLEKEFGLYESMDDSNLAKASQDDVVAIVQQMISVDETRARKLLERFDKVKVAKPAASSDPTIARIENMESLPDVALGRIPPASFEKFIAPLREKDLARANKLEERYKKAAK